MTSISIPNSVRYIRRYAFYNCKNITSISIPDSVYTISANTFYGCINLETVTIGSGVGIIENEAFYTCANLKAVTCNCTRVPNTGTEAFRYSPIESATLYVPEESIQDYKNEVPWIYFGTVKPIKWLDSDALKCEAPAISYEDGKLYFSSATPEATVCHTITCSDTGDSEGDMLDLKATYTITAYATKVGYFDSDLVTATLVWATASLIDEGSSIKSILVDSMPLLTSQEAGEVTVRGLQAGDVITAYSTNGRLFASEIASGSTVTLRLTDLQGQTAILKVGNRSAKLMIKQ